MSSCECEQDDAEEFHERLEMAATQLARTILQLGTSHHLCPSALDRMTARAYCLARVHSTGPAEDPSRTEKFNTEVREQVARESRRTH